MMTEIMIAIIGSGIITKLLDMIIEAIKRRKNPIRVGMRFCLLDYFERYGNRLKKQGSVTSEELKKAEEMYKTYKALGGDGYADKLYAEIKEIPIKVAA